jgi:ABC-type spermidine/putrescine transport system permease subunit II
MGVTMDVTEVVALLVASNAVASQQRICRVVLVVLELVIVVPDIVLGIAQAVV